MSSRRPDPRQVRPGARPAARRFPRPTRALVPVTGTVLALGGWAAVAHNSGSGWVQALGALLAGFLGIGLLAPAALTWGVRLTALDAPIDGVAGRTVSVRLLANRPLRVTPLVPVGEACLLDGRNPGTLGIVATRHCELESCAVRVASAAPFGLLWWHRDLRLALPRPVLVAPRATLPSAEQLAEIRRRDDAGRPVAGRVGEPRGVRPYQPGDQRHWVHWPATAHAGMLMVREMEGPLSRPVTIRVDLPDEPEAAERAAEAAFATLAQLLGTGRQVQLVTLQADGECAAPVTGVLDAGRRLARAVAPGWRARLPAAP